MGLEIFNQNLARIRGLVNQVQGSDVLVSQSILNFISGTEDSCSVYLVLPILLDHSELNSEPVDNTESSDLLVSGSQGQKPDLLGNIADNGVGEHRNVAEVLVHKIRLGSVEGAGPMSDVLGAREGSEG